MKTGVDERINIFAKKVEEQTSKVTIVGEEEKEMKKTIELENWQNDLTNTMVARGGEKERKKDLEDETEKQIWKIQRMEKNSWQIR